MQKCTLVRSTRGGKNPGVWADVQIALAYAQWIDPVFHQMVNQAFLEWFEEERDPSLKISRGVEKWLRRGKSEAWVGGRIDGMLTRKRLMDILRDAGCVDQNTYIVATQIVTYAVVGQNASTLKKSLGLPKSATARDAMTERQLQQLQFVESEIAAEITSQGVTGDEPCMTVVKMVCRRLAPVLGGRLLNSAG